MAHQGVLVLLSLVLSCYVSTVQPYSKYGRNCNDIGCLPNEECVITSDSCSYNQRDGKDCGSYPTCKRRSSGASSSHSPSSSPSAAAVPSAPLNPSGSNMRAGSESNIHSIGSSNLKSHIYINPGSSSSNSNTGSNANSGAGIGGVGLGISIKDMSSSSSATSSKSSSSSSAAAASGMMGVGSIVVPGSGGMPEDGTNGVIISTSNGGQRSIDPHYVFGARHTMPILPNLPIFPYNAPTQAPPFQQFPQPNHPGNIYNPGLPQGLQPVNPYSSPFVFGQQPFYSAPAGTGGPPGGSNGILGNSGGGGLAPYWGNYPSPNMYHKQPSSPFANSHGTGNGNNGATSQSLSNGGGPQQIPYNRQTQGYPSSANSFTDRRKMLAIVMTIVNLLFMIIGRSGNIVVDGKST